MRNKIAVIVLLLVCVNAFSCKKKSDALCDVTGTVRDYSGQLDGCGQMIDLDNGERLMPVELPQGTSLVNGKRVSICFISKPVMNICMTGETVKITSIIYLP